MKEGIKTDLNPGMCKGASPGGFSATPPGVFLGRGGVAHKFSLTRGVSSLRKILGGCCAYNIGIKLKDLSCCLQKIG